jgi:hypothetical protein
MNFKNKNYTELLRERDSLNKEYLNSMDDCAKKGLTYDVFCENTTKIKTDLYLIDKYLRLKQEPIIVYGKEWKGDFFTLEEFIKKVKNNELNEEGVGYYATENSKSDIEVYYSDIIENIYRTDFTHIIWNNITT